MRKELIIDNKKTGFSNLADKMEMSVPVTDIKKLDEGKHHELTWTIRGQDSSMYKVEPGNIDKETNELVSVKLRRKSKDINGSIYLSVVLEYHEESYDEIIKRQREEEEFAKKGAKLFLNEEEKEKRKKPIIDLATEIDDLYSQTKMKRRKM